jgi:hypothetical protein
MNFKITPAHAVAVILALVLLAFRAASAEDSQVAQPPPPPPPQLTVAQYDQLLAPVALYPDQLLAQILTAATYPLEVVEADRWVQTPDNGALQGEQLNAALAQQPWDPSVKSLVPFPQILKMMDDNLGWTEQLGDAFLANEAAVMDAVQRLRHRSQAAGTLQSNAQEIVTSEGSDIAIEPSSAEEVYVPVYDPDLVYGDWPYADYPPYYFPGYFDVEVVGGFGWFGFGINVPLWGWGHWDWRHHRIDVDRNRFNMINAHHRPISSGTWEHNPSHRAGVPYRDAGTRARFAGAGVTPETRQTYRGYPPAAPEQAHAAGMVHPAPVPQLPRNVPPRNLPVPPAMESFGRGSEVQLQSERGRSSRQSMPSVPSGGGGGGPRPTPGFGIRPHR